MNVENITLIDLINRKEIYRYLGYRNIKPDEAVDKIIEDVIEEGIKIVNPKSIMQRFKLEINDINVRIFDDKNKDVLLLKSKNLSDNLKQCDKVCLFAATLGVEADSYVKKLSYTNMAKAGIAQAVFAAAVEAFCNLKQDELAKSVLNEGYYLRPRFSPGYGDLALETQRDFFKSMEITKRIGITLTDSCLMVPTKSVSAIIGLTKNENNCHINKCKTCTNKGCEFRNEDND